MKYLILLPIISIIISILFAVKAVKSGKDVRRTMAVQVLSVFAAFILTTGASVVVSAETTNNTDDNAVTTSQTSNDASNGLGMIGIAISIGAAVIGSGIAVAAAAPAAISAAAEDPKTLGKSIIFVGMAEGLSVFGLIISIMLMGKL